MEHIIEEINESISVKSKIKDDKNILKIINDIISLINKILKNNGKILLFGNGGSASDAMHIAGEFVGKMKYKKDLPLAAIALSENVSTVTSIANDFSYESIFSKQIEALGNEGDIAIGISTSGKSANVLEALKTSKSKKLNTVLLTGMNKINNSFIDYIINIPSNSTQRIQESHIMIGHIIVGTVEKYFHTKNCKN